MTADPWGAVSARIAAVLLDRPELVDQVADEDVAPGPHRRLVALIRRRHLAGLDARAESVLSAGDEELGGLGGRGFVLGLVESDYLVSSLPRYLREARRLAVRDGLRRIAEGAEVDAGELRRLAGRLDHDHGGVEPASVALAGVRELRVAWLADGLIPWGALTQIVGRGGQGKTTFAAHVAARLTRGQPIFPGMAAPDAADVLIASAEDSIAHVLRPRLRIAGADLERVHAWNIGEHDLVLPDGVDLLEREVARTAARLVIVDPLAAFIAGRVDTHRDAGLRGVLRPLHALAERSGLAVLGILHVNQAAGGDVAVRVSGSGAWINAARSALVFGPPPDAEDSDPRRVVALAKSNYAPLGASFEVTLRVPDGEEHPAISYVGASRVRAHDVLTGPGDEEERTGAQDCADWLAGVLAGGARASQDVKRDAKAAGYTAKNLRQARERLGVVARREGFPSATYWALPDTPAEGPSTVVPSPKGTTVVTDGRARLGEPYDQAVLRVIDGGFSSSRALSQSQGTTRTVAGAERRSCKKCGDPWPRPGSVCDPCLEDGDS